MPPLPLRPPPALSPGAALLPLRLFLGATFVYAGVQKLSDPGFLTEGSATYIGSQLEGFADGTPGGWLLETFALPFPEVAGVGVALTEIAIGLLALAGRYTRAAAAAGLGLSLVLFLTATWRTRPYFLGSDIVFAFAWLPLVLAGAAGQPALDHVRPRPLRLRRRGRLPVPVRVYGGPPMTRHAALVQALGFTGGLTALLAGLGMLVRGDPPPVARAASGAVAEPIAASADVAPGASLTVVNPADGTAALLVRDADGTLAALGAVCTHAGCDVVWRAGEVLCPCHDSAFDLRTGEPQRGPASVPLPVLPVSERDGRILLG